MTEPHAPPCLAMIGGRLELANTAIYAGLRERCRGRLLVIATASQIPQEVGPETVADMLRHRIDADLLPLTFDNHRRAAFDPALVTMLDGAGGVFFSGGDQSQLLAALRQDGGDTPVLQAIYRLAARGGLISGSSAGAAVMSARSILGGTSLEAVVYGVAEHERDPGLLLGDGLGFFRHGLVDQHFLQRGRIGRLLVAVAAVGDPFGFGVDENTALFVDGHCGSVVGEKGVIVIDARAASFDINHRHYDRFRVSYLDDGDRWDFERQQALPQSTRKPVRHPRDIHGPGFMQRSVFGPYAFDELLTRLAAGDPARYGRDHAVAYEPDAEIEVAVGVERAAERGATLVARRGRSSRYTVLDYGLDVHCRSLSPRQHRDWLARHTKQLMRGRSLAADSQLIAIGAAIEPGNAALFADLRALRREVTVIAAAAAAGREAAIEYVQMLRSHGIPARPFDEQEEQALDALAVAPAILFTGGSQERLLKTLFTLGEESPLLHAVLDAYRQGGCVIAVGGSANALSGAMIAGGSSEEAIRFGASPDPWYRGVVLQEGLGLMRDALIDQHFVGRQRLGRLLVGCVEEGLRWGFGLAEDSGLSRIGAGTQLRALGSSGFCCLDLRQSVIHPHRHGFSAKAVELLWVAPGQSIDLLSGQLHGAGSESTPLPGIVQRFLAETRKLAGKRRLRCEVELLDSEAHRASVNVLIERSPDGRRSWPELDHRGGARS